MCSQQTAVNVSQIKRNHTRRAHRKLRNAIVGPAQEMIKYFWSTKKAFIGQNHQHSDSIFIAIYVDYR